MTKEAAIDLIAHYDERVNAGMSVTDQIDFLTSNYKLLGEMSDVYRDPMRRNIISGFDNIINGFAPSGLLFQTSSHAWDLYDPGVLKTIPYDRQVILAQIGSHYDETSFVYTKIVNALFLP